MMFIFNSIFEAVAFNSMERSAIYNPRNIKYVAIQFLKWWCSSLKKGDTPNKHFPTWHSVHVKANMKGRAKFNYVK